MTQQVDRKIYDTKLPKEIIDKIISDAETLNKLWNECKDFDIYVPYLTSIVFDEPFLGSIIKRIEKIVDITIPTAAICFVNDSLQLRWNPIFFQKMLADVDKRHVVGVLKHEIFHICFGHVTHRVREPAILWNVATDCAINSIIPRYELPDFALIPGEMMKHASSNKNWKPSIIAELVASFEKELSADEYMDLLLNNEEVKQAIDTAKNASRSAGTGQGDGGGKTNNEDSEGQATFDDILQDILMSGDGSTQFDDHKIWQMSDGNRDMAAESIRDLLRECTKIASQHINGWGSIPTKMQEQLKRIVSNVVDWREILNQFVGKTRSTMTTSSIKRINRRAPWEFPGRKKLYRAKPAVGFDQSGSMNNKWIEMLFAELSNMANIAEYDILPFDTSVDEKSIQVVRKGMKPNIVRTKCGGTDFNAPIKYVNENKERYDVLIILTDGGAAQPIKCDLPVAYVVVPGQKLYFNPENSLVVQMVDK